MLYQAAYICPDCPSASQLCCLRAQIKAGSGEVWLLVLRKHTCFLKASFSFTHRITNHLWARAQCSGRAPCVLSEDCAMWVVAGEREPKQEPAGINCSLGPQVTLYRAALQVGPGVFDHHFLIMSLVGARILGLVGTYSNHLQAQRPQVSSPASWSTKIHTV